MKDKPLIDQLTIAVNSHLLSEDENMQSNSLINQSSYKSLSRAQRAHARILLRQYKIAQEQRIVMPKKPDLKSEIFAIN